MANPTYREWLQQQATSHNDPNTRAQAQALLNVVGDDRNIDARFIAGDRSLSTTSGSPTGISWDTGSRTGVNTAEAGLRSNGYSAIDINRGISPTFSKMYDADMRLLGDGSGGNDKITGNTNQFSTGGADAQRRAINEASRNATQQSIAALGTALDTNYKNIDDEYNSISSKYAKERATAEDEYNTGMQSNQQDLLRNKQNALLAAAQGNRGLSSVMASLGALSGTGLDLRDRAIRNQANADLAGAGESYRTNADTLGKAWTNFKNEDEEREAELTTSRQNQRMAAEGKNQAERQNLYRSMASLYGDIGDSANATHWLNQAGALSDPIARNQRAVATQFNPRSAAFTPGTLRQYLAGAGDMTVNVAGGGQGAQVPNIFSGLQARRRREEEI